EARASEPEPKAPEPARKDDASVPRRESDRRGGEEESYTSRLLRAKKRALGEAGGESNDSKKK
ncbi:MAG TPA: hypothetical protein VK116_11190, partial [Planctomycetota bacterium]|nr:hypothetical protein [Planctomycetota bacterium]